MAFGIALCMHTPILWRGSSLDARFSQRSVGLESGSGPGLAGPADKQAIHQ